MPKLEAVAIRHREGWEVGGVLAMAMRDVVE